MCDIGKNKSDREMRRRNFLKSTCDIGDPPSRGPYSGSGSGRRGGGGGTTPIEVMTWGRKLSVEGVAVVMGKTNPTNRLDLVKVGYL